MTYARNTRRLRPTRRPADTRPIGTPDRQKLLWHHGGVAISKQDEEDLLAEVRKAAAALKRAEEAADAKRAELAAKVAKAVGLGVKPTPLVQASGKSAQTIRQWSLARGVKPLRAPTAGSFGHRAEQADA